MRFSKQFAGEYMANNCPHCHSLQGSTISLELMYNFITDTIQNLDTHISETIPVTETSLPKSEWKSIIIEILKYQNIK